MSENDPSHQVDGSSLASAGRSSDALPSTSLSRLTEGALKKFGSIISAFWLALMAVIVMNVAMKNLWGEGRIEFEELQWHLYSAIFMLGLSVAIVTDDHVRVDLLYTGFSLRTRAWVELIGTLLLLLPFAASLLFYAIPFVLDSWLVNERSSAPAGLSHRWLIKSVLVLGVSLIVLAALAKVSRVLAYFRKCKCGDKEGVSGA